MGRKLGTVVCLGEGDDAVLVAVEEGRVLLQLRHAGVAASRRRRPAPFFFPTGIRGEKGYKASKALERARTEPGQSRGDLYLATAWGIGGAGGGPRPPPPETKSVAAARPSPAIPSRRRLARSFA